MTYPFDAEPKKYQMLVALKTILEGIQQPAFHHGVRRVTLLDSGRFLEGDVTPSIAIVPVSDIYTQTLGCLVEERRAGIELFGVIRLFGNGDQWKKELHWMIADMQRAISADIKLNSTATYTDMGATEVYESKDSTLFLAKLSIDVTYRQSTTDPTA